MARWYIVALVILVSSIDSSKSMLNSVNVAIVLDLQASADTATIDEFKTVLGGERNSIEPFVKVFENAKNRSMKTRMYVAGIIIYVNDIADNGTMEGFRHITFLNDLDKKDKTSALKGRLVNLGSGAEGKVKWRRRADLLEADDTKMIREFNQIIDEGAPVVPVLIRRIKSMEPDVVKNYLEKIRAEEDNHGYLIVADSYAQPSSISLFDLTSGKRLEDVNNAPDPKKRFSFDKLIDTFYMPLRKHMRSRLESCPYEPVFVEGECFWYHIDSCRKRVARITNSSAAPFPKYCLSGHHYRRDCDKSVCEKVCANTPKDWSKCDAECGWGVSRRVITDHSVSPFLKNCEDELYPELKHCYVECYGVHLMISGGVLMLLAILGAVAVGWIVRPEKPQKKRLHGGWSASEDR